MYVKWIHLTIHKFKKLINLKTTMNKEQLRELVKAHFNLVDPSTKFKFGEIFDENKAFKIVFPGDELEVGDKVKVVTAEDQEMDAPDGFHKLEDGRTIKTEDSVVTEIAEFDDEKNGNGNGNGDDKEEFAADPEISEVEGTTAQNASTDVNPDVEADIKTVAEIQAEEEFKKKIKMAVDEEIASTITGIKEEMKLMKTKLDKLAAEPAKEKTMMSSSNTEKFSSDSLQAPQMKVMRELLKNKNK
jgi:hypothetical protein